MNDRLKDFTEVTGKAFKESFSKLNKVYIAFIVILISSLFQNYKYVGIFGGNYIGGLISYFIEAVLICFVIQALRSVVVYSNPGKKSIGNSVGNFIQPVLSTLFYYYLIEIVIRWIFPNISKDLTLLLLVVFRFLMTALFEEVYINGSMGFDAVKNSAKFVCDNILTYGVISIIFILIEFYITYNFTVGMGIGIKRTGFVIILAILELFFYLVRGHMYKYLNNHSYRQRKFMRG